MRLLDCYFLRELAVPLGYCLCGFLIFWLTFDLFGELEDFQKAGLAVTDIGYYYLQKLPELLVVVLPVALLLAMLYSLTNHSRHNEFIAVRTAGVSIWRFSAVYLIIGGLFSLLLFWINERWAPRDMVSIESLQARRNAALGGKDSALWIRPLLFENHNAGRLWTVDAYNWHTAEMENPRIQWKLSGEVTVRLIAESGGFTNGVWTFRNLKAFHFDPEKPKSQSLQITNYPVQGIKEFTETPQQLRSEMRISRLSNAKLAKESRVSLREIEDYLALHPELPAADKARLDTQYHGRLAWPFTCLVVVLIAIPFGASARRRNAFVGVASSVVICFVYFILMRVGLALGTGGTVPPWFGAWLPNLLFGGGAGLMITRMR
ncbi:MAG: hypothetical protein M2R45_04509 [Verrucomicrobia subdivision 3 bacterium]|nr:hypothetical protein [Limisphaerales bacterium]MCS1415944.1 hypothetical protein [Limisphaerales bacterium]